MYMCVCVFVCVCVCVCVCLCGITRQAPPPPRLITWEGLGGK